MGGEDMIPPSSPEFPRCHRLALRQPVMKRVGVLLPGGRGLFKPIDRDSYAKVIKQLLVFAVLALEQRVMASLSSSFIFFKSLPAV